MTDTARRGLLIVDVQNDFCEGGALAVEGGAAVAAAITAHVASLDPAVVVVASADWHVDPGAHFAKPGEQPDYHDSWPVHCVAGSAGAAFHPALRIEPRVVVRKGEHAAAYSAFDGVTAEGRTLESALRDAGVGELDVCGIATDYCVRASALDAVRLGFGVRVLEDLCAGVAPESTRRALEEMRGAGVLIAGSATIPEHAQWGRAG